LWIVKNKGGGRRHKGSIWALAGIDRGAMKMLAGAKMKTEGLWKISFTNFQILQMLGRVSRIFLLTAI
jgi:hypothetical protein